jgi:hypothetical protein
MNEGHRVSLEMQDGVPITIWKFNVNVHYCNVLFYDLLFTNLLSQHMHCSNDVLCRYYNALLQFTTTMHHYNTRLQCVLLQCALLLHINTIFIEQNIV